MADQGLNVQDVVTVTISLTAIPASFRNFGACMVAGSSPVIDVNERRRKYSDLNGVATDFGTTTPEYLFAQIFFAQEPQPSLLYVARFAQVATSGILHGASLTPAQRLVTLFNAVTTGALLVIVDGVPYALTGLNFSGQSNLNGVASVIQTALQAAGAVNARVIWGANNTRFDVISGTTGVTSTVGYAKAPTAVGRLAFSTQPVANSTVTLNGTALTFIASGTPTVNQVLIGANLAATLQNLVNTINNSVDAQVSLFTAFSTATSTYLYADTPGAAGNALTLAASSSPASGATVTAMSGGSGTDISVLLGLSVTPNSTGANADPPVNGVAPETALACTQSLADKFGDWYALAFAPLTALSDADHVAVAGDIEAEGRARIYGVTSQNTTLYDSTRSDDLASTLQALKYSRTMIIFSSTTPYAVGSVFGRFATVNYLGSNTTLTLKFKQLPGVVSEKLSENQAATLKAKNCNVSAYYQDGSTILQEGVMCSGIFIDSRINADWLANYVQTNVFNFMKSIATKIPQTDKGMNTIAAIITASLTQAVINGYLAPGVWNAAGFGTLSYGDYLKLGYYIYVPPVDDQDETTRAQRASVPFQVAAKEAGAVHSANIAILVNP